MASLGMPGRDVRRGRRLGWRAVIISGSAVLAAAAPMSSVSAASTADTVVTVRVTDEAGAPVAGAAVLTTVLWSSKSNFRRFGHARGHLLHANAEGELEVPIRLDRQQRAAARRNGNWVSISVVAFDRAMRPVSFATTSRYVGTQPETPAQARSMPRAEVVRLVEPRPSQIEASGVPALAESLPSCPYYYWEADSYWNRFAQVGELHADYDVKNARFTYGQSADTTFDVLAKAPGDDFWSVSGGAHIANSRDAAVYAETAGATNYHWALRTQFRFVNMRLFKDCVGGPYHAYTGSQMIYALEWTGNGMTLSSPLTQPARKSANSAPYGSHTGWVRSSATLVKWSAAVSVLGASLGAQSGASSYVRMEYSFGGRPTHYLYGDTGLPTESKRVFQDTP